MVTLYGRFNHRLFLNYGSRYDCIAMSAIITQLRNLIGLAKYLDLGVDTCKLTRVAREAYAESCLQKLSYS